MAPQNFCTLRNPNICAILPCRWTTDMLCPIAQKPTRGCTGRLERPMCEKIQPVAFCRTSVIMSKEERGAVVATTSKKAAFLASLCEQVVE